MWKYFRDSFKRNFLKAYIGHYNFYTCKNTVYGELQRAKAIKPRMLTHYECYPDSRCKRNHTASGYFYVNCC